MHACACFGHCINFLAKYFFATFQQSRSMVLVSSEGSSFRPESLAAVLRELMGNLLIRTHLCPSFTIVILSRYQQIKQYFGIDMHISLTQGTSSYSSLLGFCVSLDWQCPYQVLKIFQCQDAQLNRIIMHGEFGRKSLA